MAHSKITSVTIQVPYRRAGNVIMQQPVVFEVHKDEEQYKAVPVLNTDELRVANLPSELHFRIEKGKAVSSRGAKDGNLHVLQDIVEELKQKEVIA